MGMAVEGAKLATTYGVTVAEEGFWGQALKFVTLNQSAGVAAVASQGIQDIFWLCIFLFGSIWVFATFVAYIVPAMPFLIWLAAIVGWIVLCLEAVIAAPLWLIGHAMPEGAGFAGQHGRTGYMLILSILVRPLLLVLSMFMAMIIMQATGSLIGPLFTPFAQSMNTFGGSNAVAQRMNGLGITGNIFLFFILAGTITLFTWKIFELVTQIPDRLIRWVGQNIQNLGDEGRGAMANNVIGSTRAQGHRLSGIAGKTAGGSRGLAGVNLRDKNGNITNLGSKNPDGGGGNPGGGNRTTDRLSQGNRTQKNLS